MFLQQAEIDPDPFFAFFDLAAQHGGSPGTSVTYTPSMKLMWNCTFRFNAEPKRGIRVTATA